MGRLFGINEIRERLTDGRFGDDEYYLGIVRWCTIIALYGAFDAGLDTPLLYIRLQCDLRDDDDGHAPF